MIVVCSWDDGAREDLKLAGLMAKYSIPSIFYIPSEWQSYNHGEGRMPLSVDELIDISNHFAIGAHGVFHQMLTRIPLDQAKFEIVESKNQLQELLGKDIDSFCYPRGYANDAIRKIVRKNYKSARNTLVGNVEVSPDPIWDTPTVHAGGKRRPEYEGTTWLKEGLKLLEKAINTPDSVYHIWGHSWELTKHDGWHDLETLLKACEAVK